MKINVHLYSFIFMCFSLNVTAKNITPDIEIKSQKTSVKTFVLSQTYSNILPVKKLLQDNWDQSPKNSASNGFTQNEIGVIAYWDNISFSVSQRYDYIVNSNNDTAEAFYLIRNDKGLNTQEFYDIDLKLLHQHSNGIRIGYALNFENFTVEARLGYWQLNATRESYLTGSLSSDLDDNISGVAQLEEYYSHRNFLKRDNNNNWNTEGDGVTLDINLTWQASDQLSFTAQLKDLYSEFTVNNSGYSKGEANTEGTFINSVGGIAYLPLYQGVESKQKHTFELPKYIDAQGLYKTNDLDYIARVKRQGDHNFYYVGLGFDNEKSTTHILIDIENHAPEIQYTRDWFALTLSIDDINIEQAHLFNVGISANYTF